MRLVYVSHEFGPITGGGIGTYVANITDYMAKRGHEVYLVTDCFTSENEHYLPVGVALVPIEPTLEDRKTVYINHRQEYSDRVYRTLLELSKKVDLDVIEFAEYDAEGFTTIRAKRLFNDFAKTLLVVKLHLPTSLLMEIQELKYTNHHYQTTVFMEEYAIKHADLVTSPSSDLVEYVKRRLNVDAIRSVYPLEISNGTQPRTFDKTQLNHVAFIGTVQVRKGLDFFIEAARQIIAQDNTFIFEIYGQDTDSAPFGHSYTKYLQRRIPDELKQKIVFKGKVAYNKIPEILQSHTWCVFPSRWENWPNVCLEAMSAGCIVIGSQNGGMREMIQHGVSGFVVDPYQPEQISQTILNHYKDIEFLASMSVQAQEGIKQWCDPELACQNIEQGYLKALQQPVRRWRNDETPLVSVIVPLYNQGQFLHEAINSVKESSYPNIEIVVVNDGSTEAETIITFEELDETIVKLRQENGGLGNARNAGLNVSHGEIVVMLDADDKLHPLFIGKAVQALLNNPKLSCVSSYMQCFGQVTDNYSFIGPVPGFSMLRNTIGGCTIAAHRQILLDVGGYDEERTTVEDWDLQLNLYEKGFESDVLPAEFLLYRIHQSMWQTLGRTKLNLIIQYLLQRYPKTLERFSMSIAQMLTDLWQGTENTNQELVKWNETQAAGLEWYVKQSQESSRYIEELRDWIKHMEGAVEWHSTQWAEHKGYIEQQQNHIRQLEATLVQQQTKNEHLQHLVSGYAQGRIMRLLGLIHSVRSALKKRVRL